MELKHFISLDIDISLPFVQCIFTHLQSAHWPSPPSNPRLLLYSILLPSNHKPTPLTTGSWLTHAFPSHCHSPTCCKASWPDLTVSCKTTKVACSWKPGKAKRLQLDTGRRWSKVRITGHLFRFANACRWPWVNNAHWDAFVHEQPRGGVCKRHHSIWQHPMSRRDWWIIRSWSSVTPLPSCSPRTKHCGSCHSCFLS